MSVATIKKLDDLLADLEGDSAVRTDYQIEMIQLINSAIKEIEGGFIEPEEGFCYWYRTQKLCKTGLEDSICHIMTDYYN